MFTCWWDFSYSCFVLKSNVIKHMYSLTLHPCCLDTHTAEQWQSFVALQVSEESVIVKKYEFYINSTVLSRGLFLERPGDFSGPESGFVFAMFTFRIKVSIILKMIQWNYQSTRQNWVVCELGTALLFKKFWFFLNFPLGPEVFSPFEQRGPVFFQSEAWSKQSLIYWLHSS